MKKNVCLLLSATVILFATSASAASATKTSSGTDLTGATAGVWTGGSGPNGSPASTDIATWNSTSLGAGLTLGSSVSWDGINVAGAASDIGITGAGSLTIGASGMDLSSSTVNLTLGMPLILGASQTWTVNSLKTLTVSGTINGAFGLTTSGAGTNILSGVGNSYSGGTAINAGTVQVGVSNALGTGAITLNGGTLNIFTNSVTNSIILNNTANTILVSGNYHTLSGPLTGAGGFTLNGVSTPGLILGNPANSFQGNITINSGAFLRANTSGVIPNTATVIDNGSLRLDNNGNTQTISGLTGSGEVMMASPYTTTLMVGANNVSSSFAGSVISSSRTAKTLSLVKIGTGIFTLSGANNTYTGSTTVNSGTLLVNGLIGGTNGSPVFSTVSVLPGATLGGNGYISGPVTNMAGSTLAPGGLGQTGTLTLTNGLGLNGANLSFMLTNANTAGVTYSRLFITNGAFVVNGNNVIQLTAGTGTIAKGTYVLITNTVARTGSGIFVFPNSSTNFGNFHLTNAPNNVLLYVSADASFTNSPTWKGTVNGTWDTVTANWNNGSATTYVDGDSVVFDDTASLFAITNGAVSPGSVLFNNSLSNYTVAASIGGHGPLTKTGAGSVTLTGDNTYNGGTTISAGTLLVNGSIGSTSVSVSAGATFGGAGVVGGLVTNLSDSTLIPGGPAQIGTLALTGGLGLNGAYLYFVLTNAGTAGVTYSQLFVGNGTFVADGNNIVQLSSSVGILTNGTYILITNTVARTGSGTFVFPNGLTNWLGNLYLSVGPNGVVLKVTAPTQIDPFANLRGKRWSQLVYTNNLQTLASIASTANKYWSTMNTNASRTNLWTSLPFGTVSRSIQSTYDRLEKMALAWATPGCSLHGNPSLAYAVTNALDWMAANAYSPTGSSYDDWYPWVIGGPYGLADTMVLMHPVLTGAQINNYNNAMDHFIIPGMTDGNQVGANLAEDVLIAIMQGSLLQDSNRITAALTNLSTLFPYRTNGDGYYQDGSYVFHDGIAETGTYGQSEIIDLAQTLPLLDGSLWALTDPAETNVVNWVLNCNSPIFYAGCGGPMDMVNGRAICNGSPKKPPYSPPSPYNFSNAVAGYAPNDVLPPAPFLAGPALQLMPYAANAMVQTALSNWIQTLTLTTPWQYQFAAMDRVLAFRKGYQFGISMSSTRIDNYEGFSGQNLHGWFTGDGMTYLYLGDLDGQYTIGNYWATVDPYHLAGTTVEIFARTNLAYANSRTSQNWVGGVQVANTYGTAGMSLAAIGTTLTAKKSWFMFDNEIVCLGAGISCSDTNGVDTTIEDRQLAPISPTNTLTVNNVIYPPVMGWSNNLSGATWCSLDGVAGYYFPGGANNLWASFVASTNSYWEINQYPANPGSTNLVYDNYFKLWYKHGVRPANATYAYVLLPNTNMSASVMSNYAASPDIVVLTNTPTVQAVSKPSLGLVAANFWSSGTNSADLITVNDKAAVITLQSTNVSSVGISDPTQTNMSSIMVTLNRSAGNVLSVDPGVTVLQLSPQIIVSVNVNNSLGKTFQASFGGVVVEPALPGLWVTNAVGTASAPVTANYSGTTFTLVGAGAGMAGNSDQFWFVDLPATNSFTITALVTSQQTNGIAPLAGVMIRQDATTNSPFAFMGLTPTNQAKWIFRTSTMNNSSMTTFSNPPAPYWVRIVRDTNTFTGYVSGDGATWTETASVSITMSSNVLAGLAVSSGMTGVLNTAVFDNVTLTNSDGNVLFKSNLLLQASAQMEAFSRNNGMVSFTIAGDSGTLWQLEESNDLKTWVPVETVNLIGGSACQLQGDDDQPKRFFRLILVR